MYTPRAFAETDLAQLDALVAARSVRDPGHASPTARRFASHLPVLYARDGDAVVIGGHWARANPQWRDGGDAHC